MYKLTNNFYTDITNASRTFLMNINTGDWEQQLLKLNYFIQKYQFIIFVNKFMKNTRKLKHFWNIRIIIAKN